ncbi:MAG: HlyD family efflux transporter periplasmic adaptor subunit [Rhodanobacter sp.]
MSDQKKSESQNAQTGKAVEQPRKGKRRKWYLLGLGLLFLLICASYAVYYFSVAQFYAATDDAYVAGNRVQLTAEVGGTVTSVMADDTDLVQAGQTVISLDDTDQRLAVQRASAQLAEVVRSVHQLFLQQAQQKSIIDQRETALDQARRDYQRDRQLMDAKGATRQKFEQSRSTYLQDQAAVSVAREQLAEIQAQTYGTTVATHPRVKQAETKLLTAYLNLKRTQITAPVSGYVAQRNVQVGQRVDPGNPILSIVPAAQLWVDANFKETDIRSMRIGQPVVVRADLYGSDVSYQGHVAGISIGTGAAFELLPPENAAGNWIKIVRRVPVRIALDDGSLRKHPLRLGLSMNVSVNLHNTHGAVLTTRQQMTPRYSTDVYRQRLVGASAMIKRIVAANGGDPATQPATTDIAANGRQAPGA